MVADNNTGAIKIFAPFIEPLKQNKKPSSNQQDRISTNSQKIKEPDSYTDSLSALDGDYFLEDIVAAMNAGDDGRAGAGGFAITISRHVKGSALHTRRYQVHRYTKPRTQVYQAIVYKAWEPLC